jgi:hypothetical protein
MGLHLALAQCPHGAWLSEIKNKRFENTEKPITRDSNAGNQAKFENP